MRPFTRQPKQDRRGAIAVLTALMLVVLLSLCAFAVDLGYLQVASTELQQCADSAAMAACAELIDIEALNGLAGMTDEIASARTLAVQYAGLNTVCTKAPTITKNDSNGTDGNVVIGYLSNPSDRTQSMTYTNPDRYNSVQVTVRRSTSENGQVPMFFAEALGLTGTSLQASATAALISDFGGFRAPGSGGNLMMLPFALDQTTWNALMSGTGTDDWTWNSGSSVVQSGSDGIKEVNLYPQGTGSPGNRGTVDIGSSNNSTADIARQIVYGINEDDFSYFPNGELKFDNTGKLYLNGDTGISAGVKDELASIIGQPRIIPIFSAVNGPGNNAVYTIVQFAGVRLLDVKLTGSMSQKHVTIQPASLKTLGGIAGTAQTSYFIHSPVWLVR